MTRSGGLKDVDWCRVQLFDLLGAWDEADGAQRTRSLAGLFERIEARAGEAKRVHVVAVPRLGPLFESVMPLERETGLQAPSGKLKIEVTYRLALGT